METIEPLVIHEDVFYQRFRPIRHPAARCRVWGGHGIETFGEDFELVLKLDSEKVWTVVDGDRDTQWIIPGIHYVNRITYLYTRHRHYFAPIDVRVSSTSLRPNSPKFGEQVRQVNELLGRERSRAVSVAS